MSEAAFFVAGALLTWFLSWHYYVRAGKELKAETQHLRRLTTLVLTALEQARIVALNRDERGEIVGMVVYTSGTITASATARASGTVVRSTESSREADR